MEGRKRKGSFMMESKPFYEVVAALIRKKKQFLICQRPPHKGNALLWEFVGGKVERGETKEEALIRECREELAIEIKVGEPFYEVFHEYSDIFVHLTLYFAEWTAGDITLLEHNDAKWITADEIDRYEFCPADMDILEKIKREGD